MVLTADKGVASFIINKDMYIEDQNSRSNTSNSILQVTTALLPDSMVYQQFVNKHPLWTYSVSMWHIHLQISLIPNQNSSTVLWQQLIIYQGHQRIG